ncbi:Uncharacterized protein dnl_29020 [Desulfonema limicola]|uniref:Uncharacterized protein n=1 Tax=Desulfonema limicola TaxID=45656 RepID=A0A975GGV0_9BACT|nr:hypothetical protein [Desulfonema limicola]QTA80593.1 Uncharacterized protein dnl_29020 [Desulfonema limicola]
MELILEKYHDGHNQSGSPGKVIYMDNPDLFIDIFYEKNMTKNPKKAAKKSNISRFKIIIFKTVTVVVCILLIVFFIWSKIKSSPEFQLKKMLSQGQYSNCIKNAQLILEKDTGNEKIKKTAEQAFIGMILKKGWSEKLEKGFFEEAKNILTQDTEYIKNNNEIQSIIKLLTWITDIEEYFSSKKSDTQLVIFKDEVLMAHLIDRWENEKTNIYNLFKRFFTQNNLENIRYRVYQHLDMLQTQYFLYYKDILALKNTIKEKLDADQPAILVSVIDEFHKKHPGIGGTQEIYEDISNYIKIMQALQSGMLSEYSDLIKESDFKTEPFADKIKSIMAVISPDKESSSPDKPLSIPDTNDYDIVKISELKIMPDSFKKSNMQQKQLALKVLTDNQ